MKNYVAAYENKISNISMAKTTSCRRMLFEKTCDKTNKLAISKNNIDDKRFSTIIEKFKNIEIQAVPVSKRYEKSQILPVTSSTKINEIHLQMAEKQQTLLNDVATNATRSIKDKLIKFWLPNQIYDRILCNKRKISEAGSSVSIYDKFLCKKPKFIKTDFIRLPKKIHDKILCKKQKI